MLVENGRPTAQKKKLVIKGLKQRPTLPQGFEMETWQKLRAAVLAVQQANAVGSSLEELYQAVESLCVHKLAEMLYARLRDVCNVHIGASLRALAEEHLSKDSAAFLSHMDGAWERHCCQMLLIRSIFLYLDRSFVVPLNEAKVRSIYDMGLLHFRQHLEATPRLAGKVVDGVLALLSDLRAGDAADAALVRSMLRMLSALGLYESRFLRAFLSATAAAYRAEGAERAAAMAVPEYLRHCETRLEEEGTRAAELMGPGTASPLAAVVLEELVAQHADALLARGLGELLAAPTLADLSRLYRLLGLVGKHAALCTAFREWILRAGTDIVQAREKDAGMVEALLALRSRASAALAGPFEGAQPFARAIRDAFEKFINSREGRPAELIAKHADALLSGRGKARASDAELEARLDDVLALFRYIQGKDVFEAFYKKDFAKRLLMERSVSVDVEYAMIVKLKSECGAQYTSKLEGMFKDEALSKEVAAAFRRAPDAAAACGNIDVNVRVLTSGFWPTYPVLDVRLPEEISRAQQAFQRYYLTAHSGRKLTWHSSLETCTLRAAFAKSRHELQVSLHQAVVLLLFNGADRLAYSEIRGHVGLPDGELKRTLQSLACGKARVLKKEPKGAEVEEGDVFVYHAAFTDKKFKVKINQIQARETPEEHARTNEQVLQDRQYQIDAALVRVMKARKQLSHKLLVNEVMTQLKFNIRPTDIKKRIEGLIERDYLERDSSAHDLYNYLA